MPPGFVLVLIPRALVHASLIFLFRTTRPTNQTGNPSTNIFAAKPLSCRHNIEISGVCTVHVSSSMTWLGFTNAGVDTLEALAHLHATDTPRQTMSTVKRRKHSRSNTLPTLSKLLATRCNRRKVPCLRIVGTYGGVLIF